MLQMHQRVVYSKNLNTLLWISVVAFVGVVLFGFFDYLRGRIFIRMGLAIVRMLEVPALRAVIARAVGERMPISQNGMRDLSDVRLFLTGPLIVGPLDLFWVPIYFVVLFLMHPLYAYTAMTSAVVLASVAVLTEIVARRPTAEANTAASRSLLEVNIAIRHAEVVEAMGMKGAFIRRWRRSQNAIFEQADQGTNRIKALASTAKSLRIIAQLAELAVGVYLVIQQQASIASMVASTLILSRALLPFEMLVEGWRNWVFAVSAYGRVRDLLSGDDDSRQTLELPPPDGPLVVDRLSYVPPHALRPVLRNISFSLQPGEVLGVIGPSAAGKSTLARMLVGLWQPTAGGVFLDGNNTYQWNRENFGRYVGYLPQSVSLLEGTVSDNIARLTDADPAEIIAAAKRAGVHEMIGALPRGYETVIGDSLYSLSAGQRQRIGLARALFGNPRFMVLDEPNASLDADGDGALLTAIETARQERTIVIVISHKPSVMSVADKVMVLRDGSIDMYGPRDEILREVSPRRQPAQPAARANPQIQVVKP
jgi:ATP-binding cassette subfamily C protein